MQKLKLALSSPAWYWVREDWVIFQLQKIQSAPAKHVTCQNHSYFLLLRALSGPKTLTCAQKSSLLCCVPCRSSRKGLQFLSANTQKRARLFSRASRKKNMFAPKCAQSGAENSSYHTAAIIQFLTLSEKQISLCGLFRELYKCIDATQIKTKTHLCRTTGVQLSTCACVHLFIDYWALVAEKFCDQSSCASPQNHEDMWNNTILRVYFGGEW